MGARLATCAAGSLVPIVVNKDLRQQFGAARDQDPRPTCMAFAASDSHAGVRPGWQPLSAEWAYYHALGRDGTKPHAGATMTSMLEALQLDGQPEEAAWPYIPHLFSNSTNWAPPRANPIFKRKHALQAATVATLVQCLDQDAPVLFTMSISRSFFRPDAQGVVSATEPLEPKRVHALVAVGHANREKDLLILVRNSWGMHWGFNGYAWIEGSYMSPRLLRAATLV